MKTYDSKEHRLQLDTKRELNNKHALNHVASDRLNTKTSELLLANEVYTKLSTEDSRLTARAMSFDTIMGLAEDYKKGLIVSGEYLFGVLREKRVFISGLTFKENLNNYRAVWNKLISNDAKAIKKHKEILELFEAEVSPYLQAWCLKNQISTSTENKIFAELVAERKGPKPKRK